MMVPEGPEEDGDARVCCGCLCTDRRTLSAQRYATLYFELTLAQMSDVERARLCWECIGLLTRAVRVRRRLLRSQVLLADYAARCAPFPMEASDKELLELASPMLCSTHTLSCSLAADEDLTQVLTYSNQSFRSDQENCVNTCVQHKKRYSMAPLAALSLKHKTECDDIKLEVEMGSDFEDHISLEQFKELTRLADDAERSDAAEGDEPRVKLEPDESLEGATLRGTKRRGRPSLKKKKKDKHLKKKRLKPSTAVVKEETVRATRVRKPLDIDPEKIRLVKLDPVEQVRTQAAASASAGFLRFPFRCQLCYRGFNYEAKLHNHMKKHDPARGKFECTLCSMFLPTIYSYNVHMLTHTTRYECRECGKQMTDRGCMVEHYETVHEGKVQQFTCRLCGKVSSNNKTHRGHMRNHHSGDRPSCDQCGKTFVNKDSLSEHILIHQGIKDHECDTCGARFRTKTQLKHHQLKHTSARDFYCVECDVRFKSAHNLRQHLSKSRKHRDLDSLPYACPRCPRRLESTRALEHHVAFGHEGRRLHTCAECGAQLATRNSLAKHTRVAHQGYRAPLKHVCDTCGRAFRGKNVLVNHMRTHTGEKPFECGECGRKFSQRTAMRTHVKLVHLKIKRTGVMPRMPTALPDKPPPPVQPKDELPISYEPWGRAPEVFYVMPTADA